MKFSISNKQISRLKKHKKKKPFFTKLERPRMLKSNIPYLPTIPAFLVLLVCKTTKSNRQKTYEIRTTLNNQILKIEQTSNN